MLQQAVNAAEDGVVGPATLAAVKAIDDVDRLERVGDHLGEVSSWQQLLAVP